MRLLSKSAFMYGKQCQKRLFLHYFKPQVKDPVDEEQQAIFQRGTDIGQLALQLFPGGFNAQQNEAYHSMVTVNNTKKLLKHYDVIYEAPFEANGLICAVDMLVKKQGKYYAYEVKGTNGVKPTHIADAAFQYYVLTQSGIDVAAFSIVHFNRDYVRVGEVDVKQLFTTSNITQQVIAMQTEIAMQAAQLKILLQNKVEPDILMGKQCNNPYPCNFQNYCTALMPEAEEEPEYIPSSEIVLQKSAVKSWFKQLKYPLYYLDFETVMYGVPEFDYSSPYQQIPFQFSLHVQHQLHEPTNHLFFLGNGLTDPREELLKQLIKCLGNTGSIVVWNAIFERGCLQKLAINFPNYASQIDAIIARLVDLMIPFKDESIYSEAFYGSYSLKYVLPAMVPELSYEDLDIQDGGTASAVYAGLKDLNETEREQHRSQLLPYCELDTLAMVKILERVNVLLHQY